MYSLVRIQTNGKWTFSLSITCMFFLKSQTTVPNMCMHSYTHNLTDRYTGGSLKDTVWFCSSNADKFAVSRLFLFCLLWCYHILIVWYLLTTICSRGWLKIYSLHLDLIKCFFLKMKPKITKLVNKNVKIKKHIKKTWHFCLRTSAFSSNPLWWHTRFSCPQSVCCYYPEFIFHPRN